MATIELIAVPFDGYGRTGHQSAAAEVLREAGLAQALAPHDVVESDHLQLPEPSTQRGAVTSLVNEPALTAMTEQVGERVIRAVADGRFPLVYGADCTTLLGSMPGLLQSGPLGLLFLDGHEDTMPLDVSEDGEAANTEIGLLLGLTGRLLTGPLARSVGTLEKDHLAMVGPRDVAWRQQFNVGSLRDAGVWFRDGRQAAAEPEAVAREAVAHLGRTTGRWWLHVDLDVLDPVAFPPQGVPGDDGQPGGLDWDQLTRLLVTAVGAGGCVGWSFAIYDPDEDPDRTAAKDILTMVRAVSAALP